MGLQERCHKQQVEDEQVALGVPLDLPAEAGRFLVHLQPTWQHLAVHEELESLQLPAGHLQAALAPALQQQQQSQTLLPSPGCSRSADLQLIEISVQQHPLGQQHGCVGCVNKFSNVVPGLATLQALQDGSYR
jgi:hypothetical protein